MRTRISIIVPAYNEEKRIGKTLEDYTAFLRKLKKEEKFDFEIIVVLNGCVDNTLKIAKEKKRRFKNIRILDFKTAGKGLAIIGGFKDALKRKNDLIGFVDADMATPPSSFYELIKSIRGCDCVIASRGMKNSKVKTSLTRKITNKAFNFLVRSILFFPYKDTQCGAKLFKREVIEEVIKDIGFTRWAFDIDLLYKIRKRGYRIKEIATVWEDKTGSKLDLVRAPVQMFASVVRLRVLYSPFSFIVRLYDKLPQGIKVENW